MRDLVIIPTFERPEMLWACLERVMACPEVQDMDVRVAVDCHIGSRPPLHDIGHVLSKFPGVQAVMRGSHPYLGNSYNVLSAYREAFEEGRQYAYLIEDDVMIEPEFFAWHRQTQKLWNPFCTVGVKNERSGKGISDVDYASLGVCFRHESLGAIAKHAVIEYFEDMAGYCRRTFGLMFCSEDVEQDGLILRVMGAVNSHSIWCQNPPCCEHVGDYGYHRGYEKRPKGNLEQRFRAVKERACRTSAPSRI